MFFEAMKQEGGFDNEVSQLDELDDVLAKRLLGWAAHQMKPPGVCVCVCVCVCVFGVVGRGELSLPHILPPSVGRWRYSYSSCRRFSRNKRLSIVRRTLTDAYLKLDWTNLVPERACACIMADIIRKIGERCSDISGWSLKKMPAIHLAIEGGNFRGLEEVSDRV